jgi:NADH:ubiquinone oxidoreductase subunit 6 (subunit J)
MILEVFAVGMVISAFLAIFLDEAIYSVAALAATFALTSLLYAFNGDIYVAVFQFAVAVGTLAILFLSGEMLSEKPAKKTTWKNAVPALVVGFVLSLPALFFSISGSNNVTYTVSFSEALWNLRAVDVVIQGLVILTVAVGIIIVLHERNGGK